MGYSTDLFIDNHPENYLCCICLEVLKDCWITGCNHRYCHYCLTLLLSTEEQLCAFDRKPITEYKQDQETNNFIQNLKIKCSQEDCNWIGPLKKEKVHKCFKENKILIPPIIKETKWLQGLILGSKEISLRVLSFLPAEDVCRVSRINRNWKKISTNEHLWRFLFKKEFKSDVKMKSKHWKTVFLDNYGYKYPNKFKSMKENPFKIFEKSQSGGSNVDSTKQMEKEKNSKLTEEQEILLHYTLELSKKDSLQNQSFISKEKEWVFTLDDEDEIFCEFEDLNVLNLVEEEELIEEMESVLEEIEIFELILFGTNLKMYEKMDQ
jgi:hypothetical protein